MLAGNVMVILLKRLPPTLLVFVKSLGLRDFFGFWSGFFLDPTRIFLYGPAHSQQLLSDLMSTLRLRRRSMRLLGSSGIGCAQDGGVAMV